MKLYQAVKQYGVEKVRKIARGEYYRPPSVRVKVKQAYEQASKEEQEMLFYSAVSIAFWFKKRYLAYWYVATQKHAYLADDSKEPYDLLDLAAYMLESMEPDNPYTKANKLHRKNYYGKKH